MAIYQGKKGMIPAQAYIIAWDDASPTLTDQNIASANLLPAVFFHS